MIALLALLALLVYAAACSLRTAVAPGITGGSRLIMAATGGWIMCGVGVLVWMLLGAPS